MTAPDDRDIIYETRIIGEYAQVRAIDVLTGTEVAITAPAWSADFDRHRLARRKLERVLAELAARPKGRGIVV